MPNNDEMRAQLIVAAQNDPEAFVNRVIANLNALTEEVGTLRDKVGVLQSENNQQASLITSLSLQKEQARREADTILQNARQEAADIVSEAKSKANAMTTQAEVRLQQAEMEADSIIGTKLTAIKQDVASLETQRAVEKQHTTMFFQAMSSEYDSIIDQCAETLSRLRSSRSFLAQKSAEVDGMQLEHFDIGQYMPGRFSTVQMQAEQPQVVTQPMPTEAVQPVVQPVAAVAPQVVQPEPQPEPPVAPTPTVQEGIIEDDGPIMPAGHSFNELFSMSDMSEDDDFGDEDDFEDEDDFGDEDDLSQFVGGDGLDDFNDSGLLMEAMGELLDDDSPHQVTNDPSDSGLLFDAMSSIAEEESDTFDDLDGFEDFGQSQPAQSQRRSQPRQQRIAIPTRRSGDNGHRKGWR